MRCKCCDDSRTKFILGDFYCMRCASVIIRTIKEDGNKYEEPFDVGLEEWLKQNEEQ